MKGKNMKLTKTASGKKTIKMSKKEWQDIGKQAGWTDQDGVSDEDYNYGDQDEWINKLATEAYEYMDKKDTVVSTLFVIKAIAQQKGDSELVETVSNAINTFNEFKSQTDLIQKIYSWGPR